MINWTIKQEIGRKLFHFFGGLILIFIYVLVLQNYSQLIGLMVLIFILMIVLAIEYFRLELKLPVPFKIIIRPDEEQKPVSAIGFLLAAIICFAIFDFSIALAALLMISIGEFLAGLVRIKFGKLQIVGLGEYTPSSSLVELAANITIGYLVLQNWLIALPMAALATLIEIITLKLDDNLVVPIAAGFLGQLLTWWLM